ncbi:MAG: PIN domain-containing protein [Hyphomicrobiales bacterium]|nr:PIN domain-containing protein [Hyphomicrobiales bacterium]
MLVDTSILIPILRDKSGARRDRFRRFLRGRDFSISRFTQLELLQGCKSEAQWEALNDYLEVQDFVEMSPQSWSDAARMFFDLRRKGATVRSIHDCCIAQLAIDQRVLLVHDDNDFEVIAEFRKIRLNRIDIQAKE